MAPTPAATVEFFFGPGSRYSYLAATQVPALAAETGARFRWRALNSGELIERAGPDPFRVEARRGQYDPAYRTRDAGRWARLYGVPYAEPDWERVDWQELAFACVAADLCGKAEEFAIALFRRCFAEGDPPLTQAALGAVAASVGLSAEEFFGARDSEATAARHRANMAAALAAGAFGVPTFVVEDGALFWGQDRLPLLRDHLIKGPSPAPKRERGS